MAKKSKKKNNYNFVPQPKKSERLQQQAQAEETKVDTNDQPKDVATTDVETQGKAAKVDKNAKNSTKKAKAKKEKKPNRLVKGTKEIGSELKKVSWPSFKKVVKQTGIVIAVVLFFAIVLFGIEMLCSELYRLLANAIG